MNISKVVNVSKIVCCPLILLFETRYRLFCSIPLTHFTLSFQTHCTDVKGPICIYSHGLINEIIKYI